MHKISKFVTTIAKQERVSAVYFGHQDGSKQQINIGRKNNQAFVSIPMDLLIRQLRYKLEAEGIAFVLTEESYTSKASCLDEDFIPTYDPSFQGVHTFSGKRIKRGLYQSKNGTRIQADCNGAVNILRKVISNAFQHADEIAVAVKQPRLLSVC